MTQPNTADFNLYEYVLEKHGAEHLARWRKGFLECAEDGFYKSDERAAFRAAAVEIEMLLPESAFRVETENPYEEYGF